MPYDAGMAVWFAPLLVLLTGQPGDTTTVTLTLVEIEGLASGPTPAGFGTRTYWRSSSNAVGRRLSAIGWQARRLNRRAQTVTFGRLPDGAHPADTTV